jgi:hypothetical protein
LTQVDRPYLDTLPEPPEPAAHLRAKTLLPEEPTSPMQYGAYCLNPKDLPPPRPRFIPAREVIAAQPERVINAVANQYMISPAELTGRKRARGMDEARQVSYYLFRQLTEMSYSEIGAALGARDHTTILLGIRRCGRRRAKDLRFQGLIEQLTRQITEEAGG